jgi:Holliday junction resolvase RusA-like endonuclease
MITFDLPVPPSVNGLFPTVMTDRGPKRIKSKAYRAWIAEAGWMVPPAAKGKALGHFRAKLVFDRPSASRRVDLDGRVKAVLDLLTTMGVIRDDSFAEGLILDWSSPWNAPVYPNNPLVRLTIEPLEAA